MSTVEITNNATRTIIIFGAVYVPGVVTFTGAGTLLAGTILARDSVSLKYIPFVKGGSTNENGIPKAVLQNELVATGAGDFTANPIVEGRLETSKLVIDADGDASNVDNAVRDQLRDYGIVTQDALQLGELDNQ